MEKYSWKMTPEEQMQSVNDHLALYANQFPGFLYEYRSYNVSQCLDLSDKSIKTPLLEQKQYSSLNHPHDLLESIKAYDDSAYIEEAILKSWDIDDAADYCKTVCKDIVSKNLQKYLMSDLIDNGIHKKVIDQVRIDRSNDTFTVCIPYGLSCSYDDIVKKIVDKMFVAGYFLAYTNEMNVTDHMKNRGVGICILYFEKKFAKKTIELSDTLYHVSPIRYFKKIQKNGIVPSSKATNISYPDRVYLFNKTNVEQASLYGFQKILRMKSPSSLDDYANDDRMFVVYAIKKDKLLNHHLYKSGKMVFYIDPRYDGKVGGVQVCEAIFTYSNIPKELIEDICLVYELQFSRYGLNLQKLNDIKLK